MSRSDSPMNTSEDGEYESDNLDYSESEDRQHNTSSLTADSHTDHEQDESFATGSLSDDDASHMNTIDLAVSRLKEVHASEDWKRVLKHKHGVDVWIRKDMTDLHGKATKAPLYKGEKVIEGFKPADVFNVAGRRDLWDDWYKSGHLVEDLSDSTSLTYMVMQVTSGPTRPRDMSLIERVQVDQDGTVWFAATSVKTSRVPHVHGRTRSSMILNGLVLRPIQRNGVTSTWTTYYLQVEAAGLLPSAIASRMLAKRPACIYKIEDYLRKQGPLPDESEGVAALGHSHAETSKPNGAVTQTRAAPVGSTSSGSRTTHTAGAHHSSESSLPPHVTYSQDSPQAAEIAKGRDIFAQLLAEKQWEKAVDNQGSLIHFKRRGEGTALPIIKGHSTVEGHYTTEQVLATIASTSARRIWDERFAESHLVRNLNGADHGIHEEMFNGVHPHLDPARMTLVKAVLRDEPSIDDGGITYLARSEGGQGSSVSLDVSGWRLQPTSSGTDMTHIMRMDYGSKLPDFVERIMVTLEAAAPRKVSEFVKNHGHPPFFLRWGPGTAQLDGELPTSDIKSGKVGWQIGGQGATAEGSQVAWLQWDRQMYPNGIALEADPHGSCKVAKVEGYDMTAQLTFHEVSKSGMTLQAFPLDGQAADEIAFNGQRISETVAGPKGSAVARKQATKAAVPAQEAPAVASTQRQSQPSREANTAPSAASPKATTTDLVDSLPQIAADLVTLHHPPRLAGGKRELPDDAMLILTKDLYFTRSQMAVISALLAFVWALGRYT